MLTAEQAEEQLKKFSTADSVYSAKVRVAKKLLPPPLAKQIVAAVNGVRGTDVTAITEEVEQLPEDRLAKVLDAICPGFGKDLARWWFWARQAPFQRGWLRRAYRSTDISLSQKSRWNELVWLLRHVSTYPQPVQWQAEWQVYLRTNAPMGALFASAIDNGNTDLRETLIQSIKGQHPIGGPSQDAYIGLLASADPTAWAAVEQLLLKAERAEGLRQTIFEAADLGHPAALSRILTLVSEHDLTRFAGTIRAVGNWLGESLEIRNASQNRAIIGRLGAFLDSPPTAQEVLAAPAEEALLALWAISVRDVSAGIRMAGELLKDDDPVRRRGAARFLADTQIPEALPVMVPALRDADLSVYAAAMFYWSSWRPSPHGYGRVPDEVKAALHERVKTLGKERPVEIGTIGAQTQKIGSALAADVLISNVEPAELTPELVSAGSVDGRLKAARTLAQDPQLWRERLFVFFADAGQSVRTVASTALSSLPDLSEDEALILEKALSRKVGDLRSNALTLLRRQSPDRVRASVERLASGTAEQKRAAEELGGLKTEAAVSEGGTPTAGADVVPAKLDFTAADRTPALRPTAPDLSVWEKYRPGIQLIWNSLGAWLAEHADTEVHNGDDVVLLANVRWIRTPEDGQLPLAELITPWWERIEPQLHDGGVELALLVSFSATNAKWASKLSERVLGRLDELPVANSQYLRWELLRLLSWNLRRPSWAEQVIGLYETAAAALPLENLDGPAEVLSKRGRTRNVDQWGNVTQNDDRFHNYHALFQGTPKLIDVTQLDDDQLRRLWLAQRFIDEPEGTIDRWHGPKVEITVGGGYRGPERKLLVPDQPSRARADADLLLEAFRRGIATRADVIDSLVMTDEPQPQMGRLRQDALSEATRRKAAIWASDPKVVELVDLVRQAVLAVEIPRGDLPTILSKSAAQLGSAYGAETLVATLAALGKRPFARGYSWTDSRESSLSKLVRIHQPTEADTAETYGALLKSAKISQARIIETAVYAPQWAALTEQVLGWPGFESAVWWVSAHTNDDSWSVDISIRNAWATEVSQRTPLEADDLMKGAADVHWFREMLAELGTDRFEQVLKASKYASSSGGHKRAELFATALMGTVDEDALLVRIKSKRHQDSVRAVGLLPLPHDADARRALTLSRYELLRAFVASDKTSGSMRKASETAAVQIGLENLARTAGYRDPQRLIWSMESEAVKDLTEGPLTVSVGDLTVALSLDASGAPVTSIDRAGKALKAVPAKERKNPEIAALTSRATELRKQAQRMRASLEQSMVTGDVFTANELLELLNHPIIHPMLSDLILVDTEGITGFTSPDPDVVLGPEGEPRPVSGGVRIAHPLDLLASGDWAEYQHNLIQNKRKQPFKQAFRELYTLNQGERDTAGTASRRYSGHQVNPRQSSGIFRSRGWVADYEMGHSRTFHSEKITAWVQVESGWGTAAEAEDTAIDQVTFHKAGTNQPLPLEDVPGRVFSEVMRDLDLVVSVAHAAGVDPEASESTIEVRSRLVLETALMLGLDNVETTGHHARVKGTLGTYSIHLGSGVTHRIPGNFLFIIPVQAQHRGRIFLPFTEDDPRTAEIISKVVLLAQDSKIKDPTIVQQIVR